MKEKFAAWLMRRMPMFAYYGAIHVVAVATTGKYGSTIVSQLRAMEAIGRFARAQGWPGHGEIEP